LKKNLIQNMLDVVKDLVVMIRNINLLNMVVIHLIVILVLEFHLMKIRKEVQELLTGENQELMNLLLKKI